ncbi:hypothetical protein Aazo_5140 ['Nostoc azollae' 0708]|jgi:hypothetical protein|uniref:Uncharacterized protein n=1 Tax=Nostoc azollae (strain 0708) TaxID=551115 RepID=D7E036_NOSA0|nr:hypothetical protein Aazo_5140 ['Nostoc azollae' 0708]
MLEKLLLASIFTFSLSLLADLSWSNPRNELLGTSKNPHEVFTLTQRYKNTKMDSNH